MLILSDRMPSPAKAVNGETSVFKSAIVPQSVRVSNVPEGKSLIVQHGHISVLVTLTPIEADLLARALGEPA